MFLPYITLDGNFALSSCQKKKNFASCKYAHGCLFQEFSGDELYKLRNDGSMYDGTTEIKWGGGTPIGPQKKRTTEMQLELLITESKEAYEERERERLKLSKKWLRVVKLLKRHG